MDNPLNPRTHRDQKPIPTDPAERRARIIWLLEHKIWTHPVTIKMPPKGLDTRNAGWLNTPKDHWEERTFDYGSLQECWSVDLVYVNPATERIENDTNLNTAFRVWLEGGPWHDYTDDVGGLAPKEGWNNYNRWGHTHDPRLDCGAPTMEEALLKLASLVEVFYNEDGTPADVGNGCVFEESACETDSDGFCKKCGFWYEDEENADD